MAVRVRESRRKKCRTISRSVQTIIKTGNIREIVKQADNSGK